MTTNPEKAIGGALEYVQAIVIDELCDGTTSDIARRLDNLQQLAWQTRELIDQLTEQLAERMEQDEMVIAGVGRVVRKRRTSSTWIDEDSRERMMDDAMSAIIRRVAIDPASGEVYAPLANTARETFRLINDAFSLGADPKVAFRKVLGLQPDEYRSKRVTGYNVTIEQETL